MHIVLSEGYLQFGKREGALISARIYVAIMLSAGAVTFIYGAATGQVNVILGSFLFFGMGGLVYFRSRR